MAPPISIETLNDRLNIIKINKNIELVGELQTAKIGSIFRCLTCGYEFRSTLWDMYKGPQVGTMKY